MSLDMTMDPIDHRASRDEQRRANAQHTENLRDQRSRRAERVADARQRRRDAARQRREAARAKLRENLPELGMSTLWATMIVLPAALAWTAQAGFAADTLNIPTPFNQGFPASVEAGTWVAAFEAGRRARKGLPVGSLPRWVWVLALVAAAINASHGFADSGLAAGFALGALSLLGVTLHAIRRGLDARTAGAESTMFAVWRRVRFPRLSFHAASIRAARGVDAATAWELAWLDRYGVGPDSTRHERKIGATEQRRASKEQVRQARGTRIVTAEREDAPTETNPTSERTDSTRPALTKVETPELAESDSSELADSETVEIPSDQGLSHRAVELLPKVRDLIARGRLSAAPGAKPIGQALRDLGEKCGMPVAMELRDALASDAEEGVAA